MTFSIFVTIYVRKLFGYHWGVVRAMTASTKSSVFSSWILPLRYLMSLISKLIIRMYEVGLVR